MAPLMSFGDRLADAVRSKDNALCVGLDPRLEQLPKTFEGTTPAESAAAIEEFCRGVVDAVAPFVAVVKPQIAFFETFGAAGLAAFENVSRHAASKGLVVIADAKRGDISTTAEAYARAFFRAPRGRPEFLCDALTVNPYMGIDGIQPFIDEGKRQGSGIFVLVKTSNPSSRDFQDLLVDGVPLYERVAYAVRSWGGDRDRGSYNDVGAVVGATHPKVLNDLRSLWPSTWILIPGVGAQGGTHKDAMPGFDKAGLGAIVNVSRSVLYPWGKNAPPAHWREMIADAAARETAMLRQALRERP